MRNATIAACLFVLVFLFPGCGPPPTAYEGRWVEQIRPRWEGATDENYSNYMQEFKRQGPREFVFRGNSLTVSRQGVITRFVFELDGSTTSSEGESVTADTTLVLRKEVDYEESRADVVSKEGNRMRLHWPKESIILKEWSDGERGEQIVKVFYDPIELIRVDD